MGTRAPTPGQAEEGNMTTTTKPPLWQMIMHCQKCGEENHLYLRLNCYEVGQRVTEVCRRCDELTGQSVTGVYRRV